MRVFAVSPLSFVDSEVPFPIEPRRQTRGRLACDGLSSLALWSLSFLIRNSLDGVRITPWVWVVL